MIGVSLFDLLSLSRNLTVPEVELIVLFILSIIKKGQQKGQHCVDLLITQMYRIYFELLVSFVNKGLEVKWGKIE